MLLSEHDVTVTAIFNAEYLSESTYVDFFSGLDCNDVWTLVSDVAQNWTGYYEALPAARWFGGMTAIVRTEGALCRAAQCRGHIDDQDLTGALHEFEKIFYRTLASHDRHEELALFWWDGIAVEVSHASFPGDAPSPRPAVSDFLFDIFSRALLQEDGNERAARAALIGLNTMNHPRSTGLLRQVLREQPSKSEQVCCEAAEILAGIEKTGRGDAR